MSNNGNTIERHTRIVLAALTSRYGFTAHELAEQVHREEPTATQVATLHRWLQHLRRHGMMIREAEPKPVVRRAKNGREYESSVPIQRYRIHPDMLRKILDAHWPVFEMLAEKRAGERGRMG